MFARVHALALADQALYHNLCRFTIDEIRALVRGQRRGSGGGVAGSLPRRCSWARRAGDWRLHNYLGNRRCSSWQTSQLYSGSSRREGRREGVRHAC